MQLLRLEMKGFKSFADKTIVSFSSGMTGIVGPNGSGKSNITDAIRWVLGESNVRHLRGQKAEDIIFAGTEARRAQNMAEVNLIFDNRDGTLGKELAEVVITRRMYRNGESEFLINQRSCRLKDIHLLLADTGLGKDSMAIIGQNRIDHILNSKPEERRLIFEDVAGISKFKLNKEDALRRIHSTERNMERLVDMMATWEEQLVDLEAKAQTTEEFNRLSQEKRVYDGAISFHDYKTADRLFTRQENENLAYLREQEEIEVEVLQYQQEYESIQQSLQQMRQEQQMMDESYATSQNSLGELSGQLEVVQVQRTSLEDSITSLKERLETLESLQETDTHQIEIIQHQQKEQSHSWEILSETVEKQEAFVQSIRQEMSAVRDELQCLRQEERKANEKQLLHVQELESTKHALLRFEEKCKDYDVHLKGLEEQHSHALEEAGNYKGKIESQQSLFTERTQALEGIRHALQSGEAERREVTHRLQEVKQGLQSYKGRLELLQNWEDLHEGYMEGTKAVLQAKEDWSSHIRGAVGDLFTVEEKFLVAIETALGGSIHQVVTDTAKAASAAVSYLKRTKQGRVTFLPMDTVKGKEFTHDVVSHPAVIGLGVECISFDKTYGGIFTHLLGRTIVVETLEAGLALQKEYRQQLRIVTLGGEQLHPGGSLTGGISKRKGSSILSRREEKEKIFSHMERLEKEIQQLTNTLEVVNGQLLSAKADEEKERLLCEECNLELRHLNKEWERWQHDGERITKQIAEVRSQLDGFQNEHVLCQERMSLLEETLSHTGDGQSGLERIEQLVEKELILQDKERLESEQWQAYRIQWEQIRLGKEQSDLEHTHLVKQMEQRTKEMGEMTERLRSLQYELEEKLPLQLQKLEEKKSELTAHLEKVKEERHTLYESVSTHEKTLYSLQEKRHHHEQRQRDIQKKLLELQEGLIKYKIQGEQALETLTALGYTKQEAQQIKLDGSIADWKKKQSKYTSAIDALGAVNPNAIIEHEEAVQNVAFHEAQHKDLQIAKEQLEMVIQEIDGAMATQLESVLSSIQKGFQQVFSQLFGGGTAQIITLNPESILESGIEFYIQPPGKKRQQLSLLSGGERALTVIALLFALLQFRPAPFCVLDEVDAALDDANVERFSEYLSTLDEETQFIVVTHRKRTMESAQVLQGVTMVERGISRLLTVSFDDVKENIDYGT